MRAMLPTTTRGYPRSGEPRRALLAGAAAPGAPRGLGVATALLAAGLIGVLAAGLGSRQVVVADTNASEQNARLVRSYVLGSGNDELIRNLDTANTNRLSDGFFRTCIASDDRRRYFCFLVDTNKRPVRVIRDRNGLPNPR